MRSSRAAATRSRCLSAEAPLCSVAPGRPSTRSSASASASLLLRASGTPSSGASPRRGCSVRVEISTLADSAIAAALTRRGYVLTDFENVLGYDLAGAAGGPQAPGDGLTIARNEGDLATWMDLVVQGFAHPDGSPQSSEVFEDETLKQVFHDFAASAGFTRYLARVHGTNAGGARAASLGRHRTVLWCLHAARLQAPRRAGGTAPLPAPRCRRRRRVTSPSSPRSPAPSRTTTRSAQGFALLYARAVLVKEHGQLNSARQAAGAGRRRRIGPSAARASARMWSRDFSPGGLPRVSPPAPPPSRPTQAHPPSRDRALPDPREPRPTRARRTRPASRSRSEPTADSTRTPSPAIAASSRSTDRRCAVVPDPPFTSTRSICGHRPRAAKPAFWSMTSSKAR